MNAIDFKVLKLDQMSKQFAAVYLYILAIPLPIEKDTKALCKAQNMLYNEQQSSTNPHTL